MLFKKPVVNLAQKFGNTKTGRGNKPQRICFSFAPGVAQKRVERAFPRDKVFRFET